jgi:hypothetical protein
MKRMTTREPNRVVRITLPAQLADAACVLLATHASQLNRMAECEGNVALDLTVRRGHEARTLVIAGALLRRDRQMDPSLIDFLEQTAERAETLGREALSQAECRERAWDAVRDQVRALFPEPVRAYVNVSRKVSALSPGDLVMGTLDLFPDVTIRFTASHVLRGDGTWAWLPWWKHEPQWLVVETPRDVFLTRDPMLAVGKAALWTRGQAHEACPEGRPHHSGESMRDPLCGSPYDGLSTPFYGDSPSPTK